ncbi:hypothetical protein M0R72_21430, partial [Candidatus Pacearchaeota archaeon]|nr:hypothetical protein [Candidatus Pacearchaeota archaeon]
KAKTAKLAKCGECGANAVVESYVGLDGKWFYCECSKCTMDVLPEPTRARAIAAWNSEQKGGKS